MEQVPLWVSLTQIGASIFLGFAALTVAIVGLIVAYRNNFGWSPIALIKGFRIINAQQRNNETSLCHNGELSLEFWNRRKYPIVIRLMHIDLEGVVLRQSRKGDPWSIKNTTMQYTEERMVPPTSHKTLSIHIPYLVDTAGDITTPMSIGLTYYDPHRNKESKIHLRARYTFASYYR